jgi:hypothetical protein
MRPREGCERFSSPAVMVSLTNHKREAVAKRSLEQPDPMKQSAGYSNSITKRFKRSLHEGHALMKKYQLKELVIFVAIRNW